MPFEDTSSALVTPPKARLSRATKDVAFGSIAGMAGKLFEHPFDLVKVRLQTQPMNPPLYKGALDCFRQTISKEGVRGLYRGISMPVMGATAENACLFVTYNFIQDLIRSSIGTQTQTPLSSDGPAPLSMPLLAIAAAGAGAVTSLVLTPVELVKCRMQVQMVAREMELTAATKAHGHVSNNANAKALPSTVRHVSTRSSAVAASSMKSLDGPVAIVMQTLRTEGLSGLWLGQTGTLLRETGGGIGWFLAFEGSCRWMIERKGQQTGRSDVSKKDLNSLQLMGAGALAGISYNVVLFPADSVKSTMQTEEEMRGPPKLGEVKQARTGFFSTFRKIYTNRGIRGLYAGCAVTCMRSGPSSALIFLMYNKLEQAADVYGL